MFAVGDAWRRLFENPRQLPLALQQRQRGDRRAVEFEKVEGELDERACPAIASLLHQCEGSYAVGADAAEFAIDIG
jgi:hypothetical protein